ncbi:hypothetical protein CHS0354_042610 [Potamilus streckersoni]|uniref:MBD domain-containing protein n=1 Tax=Potamilus streckersoni TaxID=2493646 RepID=A0AAE0WCL5_9BIVA|nr:hypothetical protein CHS0354_042610 [Potamilus streckersoni]
MEQLYNMNDHFFETSQHNDIQQQMQPDWQQESDAVITSHSGLVKDPDISIKINKNQDESASSSISDFEGDAGFDEAADLSYDINIGEKQNKYGSDLSLGDPFPEVEGNDNDFVDGNPVEDEEGSRIGVESMDTGKNLVGDEEIDLVQDQSSQSHLESGDILENKPLSNLSVVDEGGQSDRASQDEPSEEDVGVVKENGILDYDGETEEDTIDYENAKLGLTFRNASMHKMEIKTEEMSIMDGENAITGLTGVNANLPKKEIGVDEEDTIGIENTNFGLTVGAVNMQEKKIEADAVAGDTVNGTKEDQFLDMEKMKADTIADDIGKEAKEDGTLKPSEEEETVEGDQQHKEMAIESEEGRGEKQSVAECQTEPSLGSSLLEDSNIGIGGKSPQVKWKGDAEVTPSSDGPLRRRRIVVQQSPGELLDSSMFDDDEHEHRHSKSPRRSRFRKKRTGRKPTCIPVQMDSVEIDSTFGTQKQLSEEETERYIVPFSHGWRREVVIRGIYEEVTKTGKPKKTPADVYYFPPKGSKLRSMVQIIEYLHRTCSPLTEDNFCFIRKPIYKPPSEIVRHANRGRAFFGRHPVPEVVIERDGEAEPDSSVPSLDSSNVEPESGESSGLNTKKTTPPSPLSSEKQESSPKIVCAETSKRKSRGRPKKEIKIVLVPKKRPAVEDNEEEKTLVVKPEKVVPSEESVIIASPPKKKKVKATARKSTTQKSFTPSVQVKKEDTSPSEMESLCSLTCPGMAGFPPTLYCGVCMCLFHPECVNHTDSSMPFICLRCCKYPPTTTATGPSKKTIHMDSAGTEIMPRSEEPSLNSAPKDLPVQIKSEPFDPEYEKSSGKFGSLKASDFTMDNLRNVLDKRNLGSKNGSSIPSCLTAVSSSSILPSGIMLVTVNSSMPKTFTTVSSASSLFSTHFTGSSALLSSNNSQNNSRFMLYPNSTAHAGLKTLLTPISGPRPHISDVVSSFLPGSFPPTRPPILPILPDWPKNQTVTVSPMISGINSNRGSFPGTHLGQLPTLVQSATTSKDTTSKKVKLPSVTSFVTPTSTTKTVIASHNSNMREGQILTLPPAVVKRLSLNRPLALKINNMQIIVPPSGFFQGSDGLKVFLPPNTFNGGNLGNISVTVTNQKELPVMTRNNEKSSEHKGSHSDSSPQENSDSKVATDKQSKHTHAPLFRRKRNTKSGIDYSSCFIHRLHGGSDCMLQIFYYLNVRDLVRAGQVCKAWHQLSLHHSLWKDVSFHGMTVANWQKALQGLSRHRVEGINLIGLDHSGDWNRTWHHFVLALQEFRTLRKIMFCHIPASVLHSVCKKLSHLEVLVAEKISDFNDDEQMWTTPTNVDIGNFSILSNLRELRLRGTAGIIMPSFSLTVGLGDLKLLTNLQIMSLTSLKGLLDSDWSFLWEMDHLKELQIGECQDWTPETYSYLGHLKNLEKLRLEVGGDDPDPGFGEALLNLQKLKRLELYMYRVSKSLENILPQLSHLKTLIIWPDTTTEAAFVNSTTMSIVTKLPNLDKLEWIILNNKNSSVILNNDENPDKPADEGLENSSCNQWVPFLYDFDDPDWSSHKEYVGVQQLTQKLTKFLPTTRIKVYCTEPSTRKTKITSIDNVHYVDFGKFNRIS